MLLAMMLAVWALLAMGCAGPVTTPPRLDSQRVEVESQKAQHAAVNAALAREARILRIGYPILAANADLCETRVRPTMGWRLSDRDRITKITRGMTRAQIAALGYNDHAVVTAVAPGSPAARAGIGLRDIVVAVNGQDVTALGPDRIDALVRDWVDDGARTQTVTVRRGDDLIDLLVEPADICAAELMVAHTSRANAYTNGRDIVFTTGFLRLVDDDAMLAFVVSHELAHILGRHVRKQVFNGFVSGAVVYGPVLSAPAAIGDQMLAVVGVSPERPVLTTTVQRAIAGPLRTRSFEREADYLGLYLYARAGGDMADLEEIWAILSTENPLSIWGSITHPNTPERVTALRAAREEILTKAAAGVPLVPEGWPVPPGVQSQGGRP